MYGGTNARNLLFALRPKPTITFVEGDGLRRVGASSVLRQLETRDWFAPESAKAQSENTDRCKLGLVVRRVLTPGSMSSVNRDPDVLNGVLDRRGIELLRQALGADRTRRPACDEWTEYFKRLVTGRSTDHAESGSGARHVAGFSVRGLVGASKRFLVREGG